MKYFLKIFTVAFLVFVILFSGVFLAFNTFMKDSQAYVPVDREEDEHFAEEEIYIEDDLQRAVVNSNRVNFVLLGLEGPRSDSIMFVSFDPDNGGLDIISIPRDTYYPRVGYEGLGKKKINAVYGDHGAEGVKEVVSDILWGIPVDYYVTVTYKGAEAIVNSIGGVPVTIPSPGMYYRDDYDNPPLVINFPPGPRVLNGADAVKFLRYRKPSPGSGGLDRHGDLGRIKAQQEFIQAALEKALKLGNIPGLVATSFRHVRTDITLQEAMKYGKDAMGIKMSNVTMRTLPGEDRYQGGLSYFFHSVKETRELLLDIYGARDENTESEEINDMETVMDSQR
ncbi:MAG: LCP family protein [Clostridiales bacterium]|nr:LCP family protein [Clostridiales bacterium]